MYGYNDWDFNKKAWIDFEKGISHIIVSAISNDVFLDTENIQ